MHQEKGSGNNERLKLLLCICEGFSHEGMYSLSFTKASDLLSYILENPVFTSNECYKYTVYLFGACCTTVTYQVTCTSFLRLLLVIDLYLYHSRQY